MASVLDKVHWPAGCRGLGLRGDLPSRVPWKAPANVVLTQSTGKGGAQAVVVVSGGELPLSLPAVNWCSAPARVIMEIYIEALSWILYRRVSESTQVQGRSVLRRLIHSVEESSEAGKRVASRVTFARQPAYRIDARG